MTKKDTAVLIGFLLFILGFVSVLLSLVGVQLSFLTFLDSLGRLAGFVIKIIMIISGIVIVYLNTSNWREEV